MARNFNGGSAQYVRTLTVPITATPFTVSGWFFCTNNSSAFFLWAAFKNSAGGNDRFSLTARGDAVGDTVQFTSTVAGTVQRAITTSGYSANTWFHAAGVSASATDRRVFLDGGSKGTDTVSSAPSGINEMGCGVDFAGSRVTNGSTCRAAHVAVWDVALSDQEVASLAEGFSPLLTRPESLLAYYPFGGFDGNNDLDLMGGYNMTAFNSPTFVDQRRMLYPSSPQIAYNKPYVPPSGVAKPVLFHSYYMSQGMRP